MNGECDIGHCVELRGVEELNEFLYRVWREQAQETISNLVDSMPQRIGAVIAAQGGHTKW